MTLNRYAKKRDISGANNPNYKNAGQRICVQCGWNYHSYSKVSKYCSPQCYQAYRTAHKRPRIYKHRDRKKRPKPLMFKCGGCGIVTVAITTSTRRKYCSTACRPALGGRSKQGLFRKCQQCKKKFYVNQASTRKYCSYECFIASGGAQRAGDAAIMAKRIYGHKKDANHAEIEASLKRHGALVMDISDQGCGMPDLLTQVDGQIRFVEIKNPKTSYGRRGLNKRQKEFAEEWNRQVWILSTEEDVEAFCRGELEPMKGIV